VSSPKTQLSRYFGLNFILLEILIVSAGGFVAYGLGRTNLIGVAEKNSAAVANHLAWVVDQFYMKPWELTFETFPYDNPIARRELSGIIQTFVSGFSVERVSIFDQNSKILYSTDSTRQGSTEAGNVQLRAALAGETVSTLVQELTPEHMPTASGATDHLLAYIPVDARISDTTKVRVAFEILLNVSDTYTKVVQLRYVILFSTMAMGFALFLVVYFIATRADRTIAAENRERMALAEQIRKQNEELETIVNQRTEQLRAAQASLVQVEKMAATGQLAAGVAHEINNPVGIIQNRLELLLEDLRASRPVPDMEAHLALLHRHTDRISKIVSRLLSFARKTTTGKSELNLNSLVQGVVLLVGNQIEKRGISFTTEIEDGLPLIKGNNTELEQVLINLLVNAMDATERGGAVRLEARRANERVQIQVRDTGSGISPDHLTKIFDPFFTTKDVGAGTGLGLAITYRIVDDHDGTIVVASDPDHGTTFTVHFPILQSS
jgi:signal transduction histidine kinase